MDGLHHSHGSRLPGQEVDRDPVRNRRPVRPAHRGRPARPILLAVRRPGRRPPPCRPPARAGCRAGRAPAVGRGVRRWSRPVEALAEVGAAPVPVVLQQLPRDRPRRGAVLHGQGLGHRGERVRADELEELDHLQSHPPLLRRDAVDEPAHRPVAAARGDEAHCRSCASACRFRQETCRAAKPEGRTESRSCRSPRLASREKPETTREECRMAGATVTHKAERTPGDLIRGLDGTARSACARPATARDPALPSSSLRASKASVRPPVQLPSFAGQPI
jgi:hypothetical protein